MSFLVPKKYHLQITVYDEDSNIDSDSYTRYLQRNTQLSYPLNGKLQFNMSGNSTIYRLQNPILIII